MKNLKLKSTFFSLIAIAMVTAFLSSCEKDYVKVNPNENLNEITLDQLKSSQQRWNGQFSDKITLLNYEYVRTIENEQDKQDILGKIADDAKIVANGDLNQPESVIVELINENSAKATTTKDNLRKYIKNRIEISNKVIEMNWDKNGEQFTTYCIANKEGIVWDNILGGVLAVNPEGKEENGASSNSNKMESAYYNWYSYNWSIKSFWGGSAGRLGYKITVHHNDGKTVNKTVTESWASFKYGREVSASWASISSGREYGKIQYALAVGNQDAWISILDRKAGASGPYTKVKYGTKILYPQLP